MTDAPIGPGHNRITDGKRVTFYDGATRAVRFTTRVLENGAEIYLNGFLVAEVTEGGIRRHQINMVGGKEAIAGIRQDAYGRLAVDVWLPKRESPYDEKREDYAKGWNDALDAVVSSERIADATPSPDARAGVRLGEVDWPKAAKLSDDDQAGDWSGGWYHGWNACLDACKRAVEAAALAPERGAETGEMLVPRRALEVLVKMCTHHAVTRDDADLAVATIKARLDAQAPEDRG